MESTSGYLQMLESSYLKEREELLVLMKLKWFNWMGPKLAIQQNTFWLRLEAGLSVQISQARYLIVVQDILLHSYISTYIIILYAQVDVSALYNVGFWPTSSCLIHDWISCPFYIIIFLVKCYLCQILAFLSKLIPHLFGLKNFPFFTLIC